MKHVAVTDEIHEMAALYALDALTQTEARAFESHIEEGCEICSRELESFEATTASLGLAASEATPALHVRQRLLEGVNGDSSPKKDLNVPEISAAILSIHGNEGEWKELCNGVLLKQLHKDQATGIATSLVRMKAGTSLPAHRHTGVEQLYILEGDCHVYGESLGPGDFHRAEAGSVHQSTYTVEGTLFLLIAPESYEVLDAR